MWSRGEGSGYHPLTWGYIAAEVVRRAAGRSLGAILREDICAPLGIDFWIGLPEAEHLRVAQVMKPREPTRFGEPNEALRAAFLTPWASVNRGASDWRKVEIPSANGHATASATAQLYAAFAGKGVVSGRRIVSEETWEELTRPRVSGYDRVLHARTAFGAGVMLNVQLMYGPNPDTLCHSGWGGSGAFGDPALGLSAAYITNRQGSDLLEDERRTRLIEALYGCV
jgi:CubicO group peptidase (beta-lactamase class C family)